MPVLGDGFGDSDLKVMSYPQPIKEEQFESLKSQFYKEIYRV